MIVLSANDIRTAMKVLRAKKAEQWMLNELADDLEDAQVRERNMAKLGGELRKVDPAAPDLLIGVRAVNILLADGWTPPEGKYL
jgi:hypothetical protein